MDGVLFDSISFAEKYFLKNRPGMTSAMYKNIHTGNYHEEAEKYSHLKIPETVEERDKRHKEYQKHKAQTLMFDGILDLLEDLHKNNYTLVLNTNAYNRNCLPLLERFNIKDIFDFLATAEVSKDKVEKFNLMKISIMLINMICYL